MKTISRLLAVLAIVVGAAHAQVNVNGKTVDATQGFTVNGAAPNNFTLCGNGSKAVFAASCGTVANPFYQSISSFSTTLPQRFTLQFDNNFALSDVAPVTRVSLASTISVNISGNAATATNATNAVSATTATTALNSNAVGGVPISGLCQTGGAGCPASGVPSQTCNANGCWLQYPDGTIDAWGNSAPTGGGGSAARLTITFPVSFTTTANLSVVVSPTGEPAGDGNPHPQDCHISSGPFTTGATATIAISTQVSGSGYANLAGGETCSWRAIGH